MIFYGNQPGSRTDQPEWIWNADSTALVPPDKPQYTGYLYPVSPTPWWWEGWSDAKRVPDALVIALCAFLCTFAAVWIMPLRRPGRCARCNYDVRYSLHTDRCPECGAPVVQD